MAGMKRLLAIGVVAVGVLAAQPSRADVSLGAHFGAAFVFPKQSDSFFTTGAPFSTAGGFVAIPGLRIGFTGGTGHHEGYIDTAFRFDGNYRTRSFLVTGNYQYNFNGGFAPNTVFLTVGGGLVYAGTRVQNDDRGSTSGMIGGGVGFRQLVSQGHGTIREEFRLDYVSHSDFIPEAIMLSAKFGFDLWFR